MKKYTKELLEPLVKQSKSYSNVLKLLKVPLAGGTQSHVKKKILEFGIDVSNFTGQAWARGNISNNRKSSKEYLIKRTGKHLNRQSGYKLTRSLLEEGIKYECKICNISEWNDKKITLQVDHIDGNWMDDRKHNLRFLCPNCHTQTKNYGNKKG